MADHEAQRTQLLMRALSDVHELTAERDQLAAELERLRNESPYFTCGCGRQIHIPGVADLVAMRERAREVADTPGEDVHSAGPRKTARHILGET